MESVTVDATKMTEVPSDYLAQIIDENDLMSKTLTRILGHLEDTGVVTEDDYVEGNTTEAFLQVFANALDRLEAASAASKLG
ncbi:hypothetical protein G6L37_01135 [Agrobacterium rubi]|nr:hypothetical protein [Agrobacterium rubi]NTF23995.1 hypothetical protein [Agrobacterium rubi]